MFVRNTNLKERTPSIVCWRTHQSEFIPPCIKQIWKRESTVKR